MVEASVRPTAAPAAVAVASERATAAAQILQQAVVQPSVSSAIAEEPTTTSHVAAVQAFWGLPSAVRRGRPPGSTNRLAKATASTQNNVEAPKGPDHEHFPVTTWSLTICRVSKDPKNNDVPPEFLANVKVFFDEYCVRGIIHNM